MFERPDSGERAALVHITFQGGRDSENLDEFTDLAVSAGARPVVTVTGHRRAPQPAHFIGRGKLEELREQIATENVEVVIFDHALTPAQERNLEARLGCRVLDRIALILDIFAQRASTFEGKLQVELAQLQHLSTRLVRGWTHLERQKGGIGLRGPGEKQLETDRRLVAERIRVIERRLEGVSTRRELSRRSRSRAGIPAVALVGYTNAGKSTLFNQLTDARVSTADRLFATLDPTLRRLDLDGERVILADTVGFIRDLPHELIAAFRATLEETRRAGLLLHVIDAGDPHRDEKIVQVNAVLGEIGAGDIPQIRVYNKIDACDLDARTLNGEATASNHKHEDDNGRANRVWVSARESTGLVVLTDVIAEHFRAASVQRRLRLPASAGRLRAGLYELGAVVEERIQDNGDWLIDVNITPASLGRLWRREGLAPAFIDTVSEAENQPVQSELPVAGRSKAS